MITSQNKGVLDRLVEIWEAGLTRRWHTNTHLSSTHDYTCGHSGRMATMCVYLGWDTQTLLRAIALHDKGEKFVGDFSYTFKKACPELAKKIDLEEDTYLYSLGLIDYELSPHEQKKLEVLDRLDCILWMRLHRPDLELQADWQYLINTTESLFEKIMVL